MKKFIKVLSQKVHCSQTILVDPAAQQKAGV